MICKTTDEYFQYLFGPWDCTRTKFVKHRQAPPQYMYATGPKRLYFIRSFRSTGLSSRLVSLVPKPRVNLTRFHGVFAPNSKHRVQITPARRGKVKKTRSLYEDQTPAERRVAMTWAKHLKRVFDIDIETCDKCGSDVRIIASVEDPSVINTILTHLNNNATSAATELLSQCRALPSPPTGLFV